MIEHWAVAVYRQGENVVTIESNCLSGRTLLPGDDETIRSAAMNLLGFIGDPYPQMAPAEGWHPIATAPKNGIEVVLVGTLWNDPAQRVRACVSRWCVTREESPAHARGWFFSAPGYSNGFNPVGWMPLPVAPVAPTEGK